MSSLYVPYKGKKPKYLEIKGQRLLLVVRSSDDISERELREIGADRLKLLDLGDSAAEQNVVCNKLLKNTGARTLLVMSEEQSFREAVKTLEDRLEWVN